MCRIPSPRNKIHFLLGQPEPRILIERYRVLVNKGQFVRNSNRSLCLSRLYHVHSCRSGHEQCVDRIGTESSAAAAAEVEDWVRNGMIYRLQHSAPVQRAKCSRKVGRRTMREKVSQTEHLQRRTRTKVKTAKCNGRRSDITAAAEMAHRSLSLRSIVFCHLNWRRWNFLEIWMRLEYLMSTKTAERNQATTSEALRSAALSSLLLSAASSPLSRQRRMRWWYWMHRLKTAHTNSISNCKSNIVLGKVVKAKNVST